MTRDEFIHSENLTAALTDMIRGPVLSEAIDILRREGITRPVMPNCGDLLHQAALNGAESRGWQRALFALESLALHRQKAEQAALQEEFQDAAVAKLKASGIYSAAEIQEIVTQSTLNQML